MKKLKMGVVGCGGISGGHIRAYMENERTELIAICDIDEPWLNYVKAKHNIPYAYTDYKTMLENDELDGISVCLPTYLHAPVAIEALLKGKHVLCEKPMALNEEQATAMRAAELKGGARLMISQNQRFGQDVQLLKMLYDDGAFGEVYQVRLGWRRPLGNLPQPYTEREDGTFYDKNWFNEKDKGGGVLRDLGSHLMDLTMHILGFPKLEGVYASAYRKFAPPIPDVSNHIFDAEDLASGYMKFEGGIGVQLEVSLGSLVEKEELFTRIYGTKLGAHRADDKVVLVHPTKDGKFYTTEVKEYPGVPFRHPSYFFVDAILDGKNIPVPSDQGVEIIKLLDALYESAGKIQYGEGFNY